jgi:pyruvate dehydrogenase E1 component alpha subunit
MLALYAGMLKCRMLSVGHEATFSGITGDLRSDDAVHGLPAGLSAALIKSHGKQPHNRKTSSLAAALTAANKAARACKTAKKDSVALVFCAGPISAAAWRRQLQTVRRANLPLVLVRATPNVAPTSKKAVVKAPSALVAGVPHIAVDAADILAVYRVAGEAIGRARQRRGPTLIECVSFSPAIPSNGKPSAPADPVQAMERVLIRKRILNAALKQKIESGINRQLSKAARLAAM